MTRLHIGVGVAALILALTGAVYFTVPSSLEAKARAQVKDRTARAAALVQRIALGELVGGPGQDALHGPQLARGARRSVSAAVACGAHQPSTRTMRESPSASTSDEVAVKHSRAQLP